MKDDNQLIFEFLKWTNQPIFLTGKAGTGKTTLLRKIKDTTKKNFAIVAPTAVAAINAGGVTMHSFFQIPFGPLVPLKEPGASNEDIKYSEDKIKLIKCLELLIIDEISMVRADIIDFIDHILKKTRSSERPFGGVQVLMIGDLYQLSPIAHDSWHILKAYYQSPYFFDSQIFKSISLKTFQLDKVYRQSDLIFLDILNGIRENSISVELLEKLNNSYYPNLDQEWKDEYVTLTTHNHLVTQINNECLEKLGGEPHFYNAVVTGDFPKEAFPCDEVLQLKVGAQIMFIKNDPSGKKQFYNGKAAKVVNISSDVVRVQFIDDATELDVVPEEWQNLKYSLNETDNKINEVNAGSFSQYPFKLAWAITIHKSQGLTFERAIIDIGSSFTHGQAYVALSRCRSLEGLILRSPVKREHIITDVSVIQFTENAIKKKPSFEDLAHVQIAHEWNLIEDLFNFNIIKNRWTQLKISKFNHEEENRAFQHMIHLMDKGLELEVIQIAERFKNQELSKISKTQKLANERVLIERVKKASSYFIPKIELMIAEINKFYQLKIYLDQEAEKILANLGDCLNLLKIKVELFKFSWDTFDTLSYMNNYNAVNGKFAVPKRLEIIKKNNLEKEIVNPKLHNDLIKWRKRVSEKRNTPEHMVLSEQSLVLIALKLPKSTEQLASIKGIGLGNASDLGNEILKLVNAYLGTNELF